METVAKPSKYFDGQGLFLRVAKNGARQWVQRITIRGKRCELGLGSPPAVPPGVARKLALENRGLVMLGGEPLANRRKAREGMTFSDAVDKHLSSDLSEFRNEKHRKQWRSTLDTYAAPVLGRKMVSEITVQDMLRVLQPIWLEKTETASRWRKPRPMTRQPVRDTAQAQKSSKRREPTNPGAGWNPAKRGVPCDGLGKALDAPHDRRRR